jgi:hypothetical protein
MESPLFVKFYEMVGVPFLPLAPDHRFSQTPPHFIDVLFISKNHANIKTENSTNKELWIFPFFAKSQQIRQEPAFFYCKTEKDFAIQQNREGICIPYFLHLRERVETSMPSCLLTLLRDWPLCKAVLII